MITIGEKDSFVNLPHQDAVNMASEMLALFSMLVAFQAAQGRDDDATMTSEEALSLAKRLWRQLHREISDLGEELKERRQAANGVKNHFDPPASEKRAGLSVNAGS